MSSPQRLTVIAGPTAVGKGTVVAALKERYPDIVVSVSATTRCPRPGEIDGVHYHFVSPQRFDELINEGEMLEWATVHGTNKYGTPRAPVVEYLERGVPVLLEIDLDGARQVKKAMPECLLVFLAPPSWEELEKRLIGRGTEDEEERARRLVTAREELRAESEFDVTVVNDEVERTVDELAHIMGLE